jgi:hypothetical protein
MRRAITGKKEAPIEDTALPGINKILNAMYKISGGDIENGLVEFAKGGGMVLGMPVSGIREAYLAVSGHPEALLGRPVKKE